jgi:hypothetical protein
MFLRFLRLLRLHLVLLAAWLFLPGFSAAADEHALEAEPPRVVAALEQGLAAEIGTGLGRNPELAIALYCDAGTLGSTEGFFRIGRILTIGPAYLRNPALANAYFALAARLGHRAAMDAFNQGIESAPLEESCGSFSIGFERQRFDLGAYLSGLSPVRRRVAELIRHHAQLSGVDERFVLAVAMAESNLNASAVSPMNAQGVMQLIPATQARFGVKDAFDAESSIKGGVAYLKWLKRRFNGDWGLVAAAYNAGEGAVDRHQGIPPYRETRDYVRRVLFFSGYGGRSGE